MDEWHLICTIAAFLKEDEYGAFANGAYLADRYSDDCPEVIDPDDFIDGAFDPLAYMTRRVGRDSPIDPYGAGTWGDDSVFTDEISIVQAAQQHINSFGPTHMPFMIMRRVRDGFELPVRSLPRRKH